MAIAICEHIKDNGSTCGSPALTGYSFCFFHQRLRHPRHRPGDFEYKLPILDTPHSILMATQHITQAALDGVLEDRRARLVLSALRLAMTTLKEMQKGDADKNGRKTEMTVPALSSRAPLSGEGSASAPATTNADASAPASGKAKTAAAAASEGSPRPWVSVTSTSPAPTGTTDTASKIPPQSAPLSAHQLKLMKKIIRRGPSHPQFKLAARLLDHQIAEGHN